jgi:hypothetical protein
MNLEDASIFPAHIFGLVADSGKMIFGRKTIKERCLSGSNE